ncbi:urease accessory protein UreD [Methylobacterium indicum]|uniref:urease accessory protein UreD n=1 Tax=Methylobacterium indicum TaxID=1775910 RepID=UPI000734113F|nr:urease accessory protein UreD [Methylobacterium indicum]KTS20326.1 urease accessory protein UreD [Methylobacterium indicum]KTS32801.1 urease accessory protein UreD [Methylobacterium indicum]KTS51996.1 urease accessory protein UreD [Methylobacterium indicum]
MPHSPVAAFPDPPVPDALRRQRSVGHVALAVARMPGGATRTTDLAESGPLRLRLPRPEPGPMEAVLLNSAGGIACGDRFTVEARLGEGADLVLTTTAAEKIYRSDGPVTRLDVDLTLESEAALAWLPQETILFDGARLARSFCAAIAPDARLTLFEALVFGRAAKGEVMRDGALTDSWRLRRAGRLTYADTVRLEADISTMLAKRAVAGGARAMATLLHLAPDAESRLDQARDLIQAAGCAALSVEAGASAWNGMLSLRLLGAEIGPLRLAAARILEGFRGRPLPRVWQT